MATRNFLLIMIGSTIPYMYEKQYHIYIHPDSIYRPVSEFGNFGKLKLIDLYIMKK